MKNYKTWLKTAAVFQLIIAVVHATTLFFDLPPNNETEKQLSQLMSTYQFDLGGGFHRTMNELIIGLSSCLSLLCTLAGLINLYLIRKKVDADIMKGIISINLIVFGILFVLTVIFTFLFPIIQIGLILLFLVLSRLSSGKDN
jgi:hypothetical protein